MLSTGSTSQTNYEDNSFSQESTVAPDGSETDMFADGSQWFLGLGPDPQFGNQVQVPISLDVQLSPNSPEFVATIQRSAGLTNNGQSLIALTNTGTINGNIYKGIYALSNQTFTLTTPVGRSFSRTLDPLGRLSRVTQPGYHRPITFMIPLDAWRRSPIPPARGRNH